MEKEPTTQDILEAINAFSTATEKRFDGIDKRFDGIDKRFDGIDKRLTKAESLMVTKDYLDEKLSDLRGDLVVLMRKEDKKVKKLVEILKKKNLINEADEKEIMSMEPFPQVSL